MERTAVDGAEGVSSIDATSVADIADCDVSWRSCKEVTGTQSFEGVSSTRMIDTVLDWSNVPLHKTLTEWRIQSWPWLSFRIV
jgi:hypothetical protein